MHTIEKTRESVYAQSLFFVDGSLLGSGLFLIPYLMQSKVSANFYDHTDKSILHLLCLVVTAFYIGRFIAVASINCTACRWARYRMHFALVSLLSLISVILVGYTSDFIWLVCIRFFCGILSGYANQLGQHLEIDFYGYATWLLGIGLTSFFSTFLFASSIYESQIIKISSKEFEQHPAIISELICASFIVLIIIRTFCYQFNENNSNGNKTCCDISFILHRNIKNDISNNSDDKVITNPLISGHLDGSTHKKGHRDHVDRKDWSSHSKKNDVMNTSNHKNNNVIPNTQTNNNNNNNNNQPSNSSLDYDNDNTDLLVPSRYIRGCGDYNEALRRWRLTLKWRKEFDVDNILQEPQPDFDLIKECYPHFIHGESRFGQPVYYELLGKINIKKLQENGINVYKLLRYYIFITEYIWTVVEPDQDHGQLVTVLDVSGVGMADLMGDALEFLKEASKVIQSHYVERCKKMFIINAPFFFNFIWKVISPMLHENTRRKISILGSDTKELLDFIEARQLPVVYGGTGPPLGTSEAEKNLRSYVERLNRSALEKEIANSQTVLSTAGAPVRTDVTNITQRPSSAPKLTSSSSSSLARRKDVGSSYQDRHISNMSTASRTSTRWEDGTSEIGESSKYSIHSRLSIRSSPMDGHEDWVEAEDSSMKSAYGFGMVGGLVQTVGSISAGVLGGVKRVAGIVTGAGNLKEAHLGSDNVYVYDKETGLWVLPRDRSDSDAIGFEDETEKRLVRAIQAAHGMVTESDFEDAEEEVELYSHHEKTPTLRTASATSFAGNTTQHQNSRGSFISTGIPSLEGNDKKTLRNYLILSFVYCLWRAVLICVLETIPAWMFLSVGNGGLGFSPVASGSVALVAVVLVAFAVLFYRIRRASEGGNGRGCFPLRALQWAVVVQGPFLIALAGSPLFKSEGAVGLWVTYILLSVTLAANISCLLLASIGAAALNGLRPRAAAVLNCALFLSEAAGGAGGILIMHGIIYNDSSTHVLITLPFTLAAGGCFCLCFLSLCIPSALSHVNLVEAS